MDIKKKETAEVGIDVATRSDRHANETEVCVYIYMAGVIVYWNLVSLSHIGTGSYLYINLAGAYPL